MRRTLSLLGAVAVIVGGAAAQRTFTQAPAPAQSPVAPAAATARTVANVTMPTLTADEQQMIDRLTSSARLAAARTSLQRDAQRAVRDRDAQVWREPTAAEAAALSLGAPDGQHSELALSGSGMALKPDVSSLEFVKATVEKDGTVVTHTGTGARRDQ